MKKRIVSAIIALIIFVPLILLGGIYFKIGVVILSSLAFKEVIDLKKSHEKIPMFMIFVAYLAMMIIVLSNYKYFTIYRGITYQVMIAVIMALLIPSIFYLDKYETKTAFYLIGNVFFLGIVFNLLIVARNLGITLFIYLLIIPMCNDIFAYLIGIKRGKKKMCIKVSPNKTWEGSLGGFLIGSILGIIFYCLFVGNFSVKVLYITLILSIIGQVGDLVMSKIKRENNIKDFSNIMPGHGGILDRLDSTIFVVLTYILLLGL